MLPVTGDFCCQFRADSHLAACGVELTEDTVAVHCRPVQAAVPALEALGRVTAERRRRVLSQEATTALVWIGWQREATGRELEAFTGDACESLLARLVDAGYVAAVREREGHRPNRYRLTTLALDALGVASLEELHQRLRPQLEREPADADLRHDLTREDP